MDKTRSFKILGGITAAGLHGFAALARAPQSPRPPSCAPVSEVFVISGGRLRRQALEIQQIEFRRLADQAGQ
jgi:hypothetical protein